MVLTDFERRLSPTGRFLYRVAGNFLIMSSIKEATIGRKILEFLMPSEHAPVPSELECQCAFFELFTLLAESEKYIARLTERQMRDYLTSGALPVIGEV